MVLGECVSRSRLVRNGLQLEDWDLRGLEPLDGVKRAGESHPGTRCNLFKETTLFEADSLICRTIQPSRWRLRP